MLELGLAAGAVVRQALWIVVSGGIALAILLQNVEPVYRLLGVDERAIPVARDYLRAASLGLPAILAYVSLRCLCEGMSWTRPAMFIGISMLALKVPLNWLFIYGDPALGVPAMGGRWLRLGDGESRSSLTGRSVCRSAPCCVSASRVSTPPA